MENFEKWLDEVLCGNIPNEVIALNFNIYEDSDINWSVELIGADEFMEDNDDWACSEVYDTRDNTFEFEKDTSWENILEEVVSELKKYLNSGKYADVLKKYKAVGTGFVDGDIEIIYKA